ncbi:MAG TPA: dCTP deaminase [Candidatus Dormibacteraeota bacterium]|nr:dCTP deaminase [Candidatus Dormibacteraeota bacterium]
MILSAEKVRNLLAHPPENPVDRLVISPLLDIDKQLKPGTASVDIRLGQRFHIPLRAKLSQLDLLSETHQADLLKYKDDTFVPIGDYFVLHPGQFVLGETLEWVHLPKDLTAFVVGKSTWGRDGLIIATAIGVHPNFSGILTLEISNVGEIPIYLYPGLCIAQLFLASVEQIPESVAPVPSAFLVQTSPRTRNVEIEDRDVVDLFRKKLKPS